MMEFRREIMRHVYLTVLPASKFKTAACPPNSLRSWTGSGRPTTPFCPRC